ncbi:MAG: helix-turn-helix transcriptional regulator [Anaerolineae bacterium]|nr:helix-turn-helix transcriptional regulator [Anaerolineae bacterium]
MRDVFYIDNVDQATTLLKPLRLQILQRLDESRSCSELSDYFGSTPQKMYYHVKELERAGLVRKVAEKRVRGTVEGYYQAQARSYWLAPQLVSQIGSEQAASDQANLRVLLDLAAEVHDDIGHLGNRSATGEHIPSLSLSAQITLPDKSRRAEFLAELQTVFQQLATKYGTPSEDIAITDEQGFRLVLMCYPKTDEAPPATSQSGSEPPPSIDSQN